MTQIKTLRQRIATAISTAPTGETWEECRNLEADQVIEELIRWVSETYYSAFVTIYELKTELSKKETGMTNTSHSESVFFQSDDGTKYDIAIFDGFGVASRLLEGVRFIVEIKNEKLQVSIHPEDANYFNTLNAEYWLDKVNKYLQDHDLFYHPETEEQLVLVRE